MGAGRAQPYLAQPLETRQPYGRGYLSTLDLRLGDGVVRYLNRDIFYLTIALDR